MNIDKKNLILLIVVVILYVIVAIIVILIYIKIKEKKNSNIKNINSILVNDLNKIISDLYNNPYTESDRQFALNISKNFNIDKVKPYSHSKKVAETINKGEETYLCYEDNNGPIPYNILIIPYLHECAHCGLRKTLDHPEVFWISFSKLLNKAIDLNIINKDNYNEETVCRCNNPIINKNILDDILKYKYKNISE